MSICNPARDMLPYGNQTLLTTNAMVCHGIRWHSLASCRSSGTRPDWEGSSRLILGGDMMEECWVGQGVDMRQQKQGSSGFMVDGGMIKEFMLGYVELGRLRRRVDKDVKDKALY